MFAMTAWLTSLPLLAAPMLAEFDGDGSGTVSAAEFVANAPVAAEIARRDFRLCDHNHDGVLDAAEFAGSPTLFDGRERGPWPDPLDDIRQKYDELLDRHWDQWDLNRNGVISHGEFISGTLPLEIVPLKTAAVNGSDPNGDGVVSRDEARGVIELLLGYRTWNDLPLRRANGCVTDGSLFRSLDRNDDGSLFPPELKTATFPGSTPEQALRILDADRDKKVEFVEWHKAEQFSLFDPIAEFRRLDTNLDAELDSDELLAVPEPRRLLAGCQLPGFDRDLNGRLSLAEFRVCPLGNPVLNWHRELSDGNNDGYLVFEEFLFGGGHYRLLAWEYFHALDWNHDRRLDANEFPFRTKQADAIFTVKEDGTDWHIWWRPVGAANLEAPALSPDGTQLALSRSTVESRNPTSKVTLIDLAQRTSRTVHAGMFPSWSPDSRCLLCRHGGDQGLGVELGIFSVSGQIERHLGLGWCAEWSPDGRRIAISDSAQLWGLDLKTGHRVPILADEDQNPFSSISQKFEWSPDGTRICFRGITADREQLIVTVNAGGAELGFRTHDVSPYCNGDIAWHPRGDRIVFAKFCPERDRVQLYVFNPDHDAPPTLFPGQDPRRNNTDMAWTLDGTTLFVISGDF